MGETSKVGYASDDHYSTLEGSEIFSITSRLRPLLNVLAFLRVVRRTSLRSGEGDTLKILVNGDDAEDSRQLEVLRKDRLTANLFWGVQPCKRPTQLRAFRCLEQGSAHKDVSTNSVTVACRRL